jgi:excisionase family DNA binding protein
LEGTQADGLQADPRVTVQTVTINLKESQQLLTVAEVAARLRQSRWSVYRKIERGELSAVRVSDSPNGPLRVPADELDAFIYGRNP